MAFTINPTTLAQVMENRQLWSDALTSGNYPQDRQYLRTSEGYCCWGVLCDISGMGVWASDHYDDFYDDSYLIPSGGARPFIPFDTHPPDELVVAVGMEPINEEGGTGAMLMVANDEGVPFSNIAKMIAAAPIAGEEG